MKYIFVVCYPLTSYVTYIYVLCVVVTMTNKGRQSKGKCVASSSSGPIVARPHAARSTAVVRPTTDQVMTDPLPTPTGSTADTPPQSSPAHTGSDSELPPSTSSLADASSTNKMIHLELEDGRYICLVHTIMKNCSCTCDCTINTVFLTDLCL